MALRDIRPVAGIFKGLIAAASPRHAPRVFVVVAGAYLRRWARRPPPGRPKRLALGSGDPPVLVWDVVDALVAFELFYEGDYEWPVATPRRVIDLGANSGVSVAWFKQRWPDAEILAVEPDPDIAARLRVAAGAMTGVRVVEAAVAATDGEAVLFRGADSWTTSLSRPAGAGGQEVVVPTTTFAGLLELAEWPVVDLVKIDIEGGEWELLAAHVFDGLTAEIVGELHGDDPSEVQTRARELLSGFSVTFKDAPGGVTFHARAAKASG